MDDETRVYLDRMQRGLGERFDVLDGKFDAFVGQVGALDGKVGALDGKVGALDGKVGALDGKVGALDVKIDVTRRELGEMIGEARRELGSLNEALRHDLRTVIEGVDTNTKRIGATTRSVETLRDQVNLRFAAVRADLAELQGVAPAPRGASAAVVHVTVQTER